MVVQTVDNSYVSVQTRSGCATGQGMPDTSGVRLPGVCATLVHRRDGGRPKTVMENIERNRNQRTVARSTSHE